MLRSAGAVVAGPAQQPLTKRDLLISGYADYLRKERGLSSLSVEAYRSDVHRFLQRSGRDDLLGLRHAEVSRAVLREVVDRFAGLGASLRRRAALVPSVLLHRRDRRR